MRITVVGGGYVGLVTGACFAKIGHTVNIVEIDAGKAAAINAGRAPIHERGLDALLERHAGKRLFAGTDYDPVSGADLSFVCVGTPTGAPISRWSSPQAGRSGRRFAMGSAPTPSW